MTTDITELAQREKFEAWFVNDVVGADVNFPAFKDGEYAEGEIYDEQLYFMLQAMWMAWKAANAELVEALEKAQQYAKERDAENQELMLTVGRLRVERENLECSHNKLRESMAAIHNTVRLDGVNTRLSTILSASKHAYDESSTVSALESRTVTVKLPKPHAHLIWIQAGHAPDDYWDDVAVSHSEKDRCCDGSERYPVYARWEIEEMLSAAGIKVEAE
ncbi:TPA: hypothetical protein MYH73_001886 [Klebsiella variicola]|uniref:hypothetical protein n=1 Tax=Klebsiella variicola TaxID=244366 RepID=UPI001B846453|nr:hypothetical protein [Klebsiella variicola]MBR7583263.1 hypothetical protein [Klebsiella variicola]HCA8408130.1 hypothetical protein [Klebsiella variicola]HCA8413408.1 hypothetical protein [Klebsiella variicola]HCA9018957.1 hypothetical protein [Klebsiella variicola]HCA9035906.1 hypothetical protein [Klebsiella variicola]